MRIIISPAKKMNIDTDTFDVTTSMFLDKTSEIMAKIQSLDYKTLKDIWKCNDSLAKLNFERFSEMDLHTNLTPAILSYEGLQYKYIAASVFEDSQYTYIENHLRILSGFYGILRPFDGVTPYRLEMQAKLSIDGHKDLYSYWSDSLARSLFSETDCILNLASKEYSKCISPYLSHDTHYVNCLFTENVNGKLVEKGTMCKMARGEMIRFMAENKINNIEDIKHFDRLDYSFSKENSNENNLIFIKGDK